MAPVIYGIPNCSTVKKARTWLEEHGIAYQFHDFRKDGIDHATLAGWLRQIPLDTLLNRRGSTWRALPEASREMATSPEGALAVMLEKPSVIKRPVLVDKDSVMAVGFAPETYQALF